MGDKFDLTQKKKTVHEDSERGRGQNNQIPSPNFSYSTVLVDDQKGLHIGSTAVPIHDCVTPARRGQGRVVLACPRGRQHSGVSLLCLPRDPREHR